VSVEDRRGKRTGVTMSLLHAASGPAPTGGPRHIGARQRRRSTRALLATVPIAIVSSLAMTLNLITPAQAVAPENRDWRIRPPIRRGGRAVALHRRLRRHGQRYRRPLRALDGQRARAQRPELE